MLWRDTFEATIELYITYLENIVEGNFLLSIRIVSLKYMSYNWIYFTAGSINRIRDIILPQTIDTSVTYDVYLQE